MSKISPAKMELLSKREHLSKDPNIVTAMEIEEYFDMKHSYTIENLYRRITDNCDSAHHGILRKRNFFAISDFFDLIKYNVDLSEFYKRNNKLVEE